MSERVSPERLECPFIDSCTAQVTQQQYESYCNEMIITPKNPNYLRCESYKKLIESPRVWKAKLGGNRDSQGFGQGYIRGNR